MKEPIAQSKLALESFYNDLDAVQSKYCGFWQNLFQAYGFKITPDAHYPSRLFEATFGGKSFTGYCKPNDFQGVKITIPAPVNSSNVFYNSEKKVMSESGFVKFCKEQGVGRPPV